MITLKSFSISCVIAFPVFAQSLFAKSNDFLELNGKRFPIVVQTVAGKVEKYLHLDNGGKMDTRDFFRDQMEEKQRKYGKMSVRLHDRLESLREDDSLEVNLYFQVLEQWGSLEHGKQTAQEAWLQRHRAFKNGVAKLTELGGSGQRVFPSFSGKPMTKQKLTKSQILQLKHDLEIASLDLPYIEFPVVWNHSSLASSYGNIGTDGGLNISAICGTHCGQNITLAILEGNPMSAQKRASYLNGSWFITRPGTPKWSESDHPWMVSSVVRNSVGTGTYQYDMGGSKYVPRLLHGMNLDSDTGPFDDYDWAIGEGAAITNNSNWPIKFNATNRAASNDKDKYYDMHVATAPYFFSIISAGNSGETTNPDGENRSCQSISHTDVPWTAEECQRVMSWGHNTLIVGAVDNSTTRSDFSSFRDGSSGDEAPHVVARGSNIEYPWDAPYSPTEGVGGTSISAPQVSSFATNLMSKYPALRSFPEAMRAIIMASATKVDAMRWPTSTAEDFATGAGIPNGSTANSIAGNPQTAGVFTTSSFGYQTGYFSGGTANGAEINRTITISNNNPGYIHWWLTWVGNPVNHPAGTEYPADDLDLHVTSGIANSSTSVGNSTEHVSFSQGTGSKTYEVKIKLYHRNSDPNSSIYLALAWAYHTTN